MNPGKLVGVVIAIVSSALLSVCSSQIAFAQLRSERSQFWHQNATGVQDELESSDLFGSSFAVGDYDGDGRDDLAIGVPGEGVGGVIAVGAVSVLYGNEPGLLADQNQIWHQNTPGVPGQPGVDDDFGEALAAGDFNHDGYDDLAIGVPGESVYTESGAGVVLVLNGSVLGLNVNGIQVWNQEVLNTPDDPETDDRFGSALAAGDFDGDGYGDLAIGVPLEALGTIAYAGVVHVLYGSTGGLAFSRNQLWHQDSANVFDTAEFQDRFGSALAEGDFDNDGYDDLAIAVPSESFPSAENCGAVHILYGASSGLVSTGNQLVSQAAADILDSAEMDDYFGWAVASGDFDLDGFDDLAVGVPREDVGGISDAGAVNVVYGGSTGLSHIGNQFWHQDNGLLDIAEEGDHFGSSLSTGRFGRGIFTDLAIGVEYEDDGPVEWAGGVNVVYGSTAGLAVDGNQMWRQDSPGIFNDAEYHDGFGYAVAGGDFDGDGSSDLAIGVPFEDYLGVPGVTDGGAIHVLYGCCIVFADGFESGGTSAWSVGP